MSAPGAILLVVSSAITVGMLWMTWCSFKAEKAMRLGHERHWLSLGGYIDLDSWLSLGGTKEEWLDLNAKYQPKRPE